MRISVRSILFTSALALGANALMAAQPSKRAISGSISLTRQSWAGVPRRKRLV